MTPALGRQRQADAGTQGLANLAFLVSFMTMRLFLNNNNKKKVVALEDRHPRLTSDLHCAYSTLEVPLPVGSVSLWILGMLLVF